MDHFKLATAMFGIECRCVCFLAQVQLVGTTLLFHPSTLVFVRNQRGPSRSTDCIELNSTKS